MARRTPLALLTVDEFCMLAQISRATFYRFSRVHGSIRRVRKMVVAADVVQFYDEGISRPRMHLLPAISGRALQPPGVPVDILEMLVGIFARLSHRRVAGAKRVAQALKQLDLVGNVADDLSRARMLAAVERAITEGLTTMAPPLKRSTTSHDAEQHARLPRADAR